MEKRQRSVYYAVLKDGKDGRIIRKPSEKAFKEALSKYKPKDIIFACKGYQLSPVFESKLAVELIRKDPK